MKFFPNTSFGIAILLSGALLNCTSEQDIINNTRAYLSVPRNLADELYAHANATTSSPDRLIAHMAPAGVPLFDRFPGLREHIPYITLGNFPTPVTHCVHAPTAFGIKNLFIKRDDLSGKNAYGGNKLRKIEFLFADALEYFKDVSPDARAVMTFGAAGSNHALATAVYAQKLGLKSILMLQNEWNSRIVGKNLLYDYATGARMNFADERGMRTVSTLYELLKHKQQYGSYPYVIPIGGSNAIGALGFVNAIFELKRQIEAGIMPEPDRIYVAAGESSGGTHAGLLLGVKAAGLKSKVIGVMIEPADVSKVIAWQTDIIEKANEILTSADPMFPHIKLAPGDFTMLTDYAGDDYALFTHAGLSAVERLKQTEGIALDGVYTGKAFAGLLGDVAKKHCENETILFWDTYSSYNFDDLIKNIDYHVLPRAFHKFFEEDVQPLDKD